jgi:hypothetical protein
MKLIPTSAELKQRWFNQPFAWLKHVLVWIKRGLAMIVRACYCAYSANRPLVSGATIGLIVPLLAILYSHLRHGEGIFINGHSDIARGLLEDILAHTERVLCIPYALTMFLEWISNVWTWRSDNYCLTLLFVFSTSAHALLFWLIAIPVRRILAHDKVVTYCTCGAILIIVAGYLLTWHVAVPEVRRQITEYCAKAQNWGHKNYPDEVPAVPMDPGIFYCFPLLPCIVVSEYCFLYGPLMGGGSLDLWFWNGKEVRPVYTGCLWSH